MAGAGHVVVNVGKIMEQIEKIENGLRVRRTNV
jgi:hypothetical protein